MSGRGLAVLLAIGFVAPPAAAFHGETCSAAGAQPALEVGGAFAFHGTLDPSNGFVSQGGHPQKWTFTLPPGEHYAFIAQAGDTDFAVCIPGALLNRHACTMGNYIGWPVESCMLHIDNPGSGPPIICAGPAHCDYVLYAIYCSGLACGYPVDMPVVAYAGVVV